MSATPSPSAPAPTAGTGVTSFSSATQRLEEIIALMDDPDTSLEDMIKLAEEGSAISRDCAAILERAELRIKQLEAPVPSSSHPDPTSPQEHDFTLL